MRLFFTILTRIAATMSTRIAQMKTVAKFYRIHKNICFPPLQRRNAYCTPAAVNLVASLYGRTSIYTMNAAARTAATTPITFALPTKSMPS